MPQPSVFAFIQSEFVISIVRIPWYVTNLTSKNFIWRWFGRAEVIRLDTGVVGTNPGFGPTATVQERDEFITISHPPAAVRGIHNGDFFRTALDLISPTHPFNCDTSQSS